MAFVMRVIFPFVSLFFPSGLAFPFSALQTQSLVRMIGEQGRPGLIQVFVPEIPVEKEGMILYDKRNSLPAIGTPGGNYLFLENGELATLSAKGELFYLGPVDVRPTLAGGVYFVDAANGELCIVDASGFWMRTGIHPGSIRVAGGNYFIARSGVLTTIKAFGAAVGNPAGAAIEKTGWDFSQVRGAGGNFFVLSDGGVVTIDSETGFFREAVVPESPPLSFGGNYFIGADGILYTVSADGKLFKNPDFSPGSKVKLFGYSFYQLEDGSVVGIDSKGLPHSSLLRVSTTGIRMGVVQRLASKPDPKSTFLPRILP
jgi:hypothetical protein